MCLAESGEKKKNPQFSSPGWKFFIRQLWSNNRFYCNFLRRIRIWSLQAPRDTPCGVKLAFLGRKPQISGVKNQFFCIFHPGNIPDRQFDPGIRSGIKNYIRKGGQIISVALFSQFSSLIWRQGLRVCISFGQNSPMCVGPSCQRQHILRGRKENCGAQLSM